MSRSAYAKIICFLALFFCFQNSSKANDITLNIDADQLTVSGLSSGAFMAQQIFMAHSSQFSALGMIAGGGYGCFEKNKNSFWTSSFHRGGKAASWCTNKVKFPSLFGKIDWSFYPDLDQIIEFADLNETDGKIDPLSNLNGKKVFLFNSEDDQTVLARRGKTASQFYQKHGSDVEFQKEFGTAQIKYDLAHGIPTKSPIIGELEKRVSGGEKGCLKSPPNRDGVDSVSPELYVCPDYPENESSLISQMFAHFFEDQKDSLSQEIPIRQTDLFTIDQFEYLDQKDKQTIKAPEFLKDYSLHPYAYAYIPEFCKNAGTCKLHIAFHGCEQYPNKVLKGDILFGDAFYKNVYNHYAETNNMIVLYPQAHNVGDNPLDASHSNPAGCWDFWGQFEDQFESYYTKDARQIKLVMNMVQAFIKNEIEYVE